MRGNNSTFADSTKLWIVGDHRRRARRGGRAGPDQSRLPDLHAGLHVVCPVRPVPRSPPTRIDKGTYWEFAVTLISSAGTIPGGKVAVQSLSTAQTNTLFSTTTTAAGLAPGSNGAAATSFLNATGGWTVPAGGGAG